jgi:hypothetical protein
LSVLWKSNAAFYGLEDKTEEVSRHFIISEPKLDILVHTARSYKCFIEACDVISSHNQDPAFLRPYTIDNVQEIR